MENDLRNATPQATSAKPAMRQPTWRQAHR